MKVLAAHDATSRRSCTIRPFLLLDFPTFKCKLAILLFSTNLQCTASLPFYLPSSSIINHTHSCHRRASRHAVVCSCHCSCWAWSSYILCHAAQLFNSRYIWFRKTKHICHRVSRPIKWILWLPYKHYSFPQKTSYCNQHFQCELYTNCHPGLCLSRQ